MSVAHLHFSITGEFITEQARSFWSEENDPRRAFDLLRGMDGITDGQIIDVLSGKKKLIGDSNVGVELVDDDHEGLSIEELLGSMQDQIANLKDELADRIAMAADDTVIVASPMGRCKVPYRKTQPASGFQSFRVLKDGWKFEGQVGEGKILEVFKYVDENFDSMFVKSKNIVDMGALAGSQRPIEEDTDEDEAKPVPPDPQSSITTDTGWLSPEGKFYPCEYGDHARTLWSLDLCDGPHLHGIDRDGWVKLCVSSIPFDHGDGELTRDQMFLTPDSELVSEIQEKMIKEFCEKNNCRLPFWMDQRYKGD